MRKLHAITYNSRFSSVGTHYNQTVNISEKEYNHVFDAIQCEKAMMENGKEFDPSLLNLFRGLGRERNILFVNHTQRDYFNKFLKLPLKDRNTCFYIIYEK